jgi:hypothetical protein
MPFYLAAVLLFGPGILSHDPGPDSRSVPRRPGNRPVAVASADEQASGPALLDEDLGRVPELGRDCRPAADMWVLQASADSVRPELEVLAVFSRVCRGAEQLAAVEQVFVAVKRRDVVQVPAAGRRVRPNVEAPGTARRSRLPLG